MKKMKLAAAMAAVTLILGLAQSSPAVDATGGNATNNIGGYRIHIFTNSATASNFVITVGGNIEVLVVAGGGGGGAAGAGAGGGGAGGLIYSNSYAVSPGTTDVTVGAGGLGVENTIYTTTINNGVDSIFGALTAIGGGGGSSGSPDGGTGGSGGGGNGGYATAGGNGTTQQGQNGGSGYYSAGAYAAGGGGGAAASGQSPTLSSVGGNGGNGAAYSISGTTNHYAGGGGGGTCLAGTAGTGGLGGGGNGGTPISGNNVKDGSNAVANTGGGGGGGGGYGTPTWGGNGGSGIVIVRYQLTTTELVIENRPATNVTTAAAWLNGSIVSTGMAPITAVAVYWGAADGGDPTSGLWTATNTLSGGPWTDGAAVTWQATGLAANATYYYRYYATNSDVSAWASSSEHFLAGDVTVTNTDPVATRTPSGPPDTGTLTIRRDPSATNDALTVSYAWGGTAVQGVDYTPSPAGTNVTLQAGAASTNITITPLWGYGAKTVWLTLLPGAYAIGSPASNEVTIADYVPTPADDRFKGGSYDGWDQQVMTGYMSLMPTPMGAIFKVY